MKSTRFSKSAKTRKPEGLVKKEEAVMVVEPIKEEKGNAIVVDTNVLINDPNSILELVKGGNLVIIPKQVIKELDRLKSKSDTRKEASDAIKIIYNFRKENNEHLMILWKQNFIGMELDRNNPDHQIIATFNCVVKDKKFAAYRKFKLISDDNAMLLMAGENFKNHPKVEIEPYKHIRVKLRKTPKVLKAILLKEDDYLNNEIIFRTKRFRSLKENAGILLSMAGSEFMAIRKGGKLLPINSKISVCGLRPLNEGGRNWGQEQYITQLIDREIKVILVSGVAGTGKTLLALAAALVQRGGGKNKYNQIILTRPAVPLEDKDDLGFLPGDLEAKMYEYIVPFAQDLEVIIEANDRNPDFLMRNKKADTTESLLTALRKDPFAFMGNLGIKINAVQHYRGRTYHNTFIIIDEAQNLTPLQIKTIITRAGNNCKIVLTGDLDQIDKKFLNSENSGLAYAMVRMEGSPMVGVTILTSKVRSEIAAYAEKVL
ncbi:MAG: PhoH family protein [Candidatus Falkowbacteria bacterium]